MSSQGIRPLDSKVDIIRQFPLPGSLHQLREFLGLINFYHRFIPHCAQILEPLNALLSAPKDRAQHLIWTEKATAAFTEIKEALAKATLLNHPVPTAPTCIVTDASDKAVGAVLQQHIAGTWCPIAYFSKKLKPAETRYSTFDRELLAMYLAVKHFQHFIEGREFYIRTDHKPLTYAIATPSERHSPRQIRHLDLISQFTTDIHFVKGKDNVVADALSRIEIGTLETGQSKTIDFQAMATAQMGDTELVQLQFSKTSLDLRPVPLPA